MLCRLLPILVTCLLLFLRTLPVSAQSSVSLGAEVVSRYVWRGLDQGGGAPAVHPVIGYQYTTKDGNHAIGISAWGAYTLSGNASEEVDLILEYSYREMFSVSVSDYFFPGLYTGSRNNYFNYNPDSTGHVIEAAVGFTGNNKIPVTALFAINVYGNDARIANPDSTLGRIAYSKYLEVGFVYSFKWFDLNARIGAALDAPDTRITTEGYYLNPRAGVINVGLQVSHEFQLNDHVAFPVTTTFTVNPMLQKVYLVFGVGFEFGS